MFWRLSLIPYAKPNITMVSGINGLYNCASFHSKLSNLEFILQITQSPYHSFYYCDHLSYDPHPTSTSQGSDSCWIVG